MQNFAYKNNRAELISALEENFAERRQSRIKYKLILTVIIFNYVSKHDFKICVIIVSKNERASYQLFYWKSKF